MSTSPAPVLRLCHFENPFLQLQPYFCYQEELCCKEGCCSRSEPKYFHTWHFWYKIYVVLGIIILLFLYRYIRWCCRDRSAENANAFLPQNSEEETNPHVVNLTVSYNRHDGAPKDDEDTVDPPPLYSVAVHLPKPTAYDEVPTYEQATALK